MSVEKISNFEELLQSFLPQDESVSSYQTTSLNTSDEKYGSVILAVEVLLTNGITLHFVAKIIRPNDPNGETNFQNEFTFYNIIIPILKQFQRKEGIEELDFIPRYFGGRLSLNQINDAVFVLENLTNCGYTNADVMKDFDLGAARQILHNLASFHAITLGFKLKHPEHFTTKIRPNLRKFNILNIGNAEIKKLLFGQILKILEEDFKCVPFLESVKELLEDSQYEKPIRETFATMIHCDCWANNVMIKKHYDAEFETKLVNFQKCSYGSLAHDVIFFLFSSVQMQVMEEYGDGLIEFYHSNFLRVLQELKCGIAPFSLDTLLKEMKIAARDSQFTQVIVHLIFDNKPTEELTVNDIKGNSVVSDLRKEKAWFVVQEFARREWI